jgi:hypothetical protein
VPFQSGHELKTDNAQWRSIAELWGIFKNSGTAGGVTDTFTDS